MHGPLNVKFIMYFNKTTSLLKFHVSVQKDFGLHGFMSYVTTLLHPPSTEMQNACNFACTSPALIHVAMHVLAALFFFYFGHPAVLYKLHNSCCGIRCSWILRSVTTFQKKLSVPISRDKKSWTSCCVKSQRAEISFTSQGRLKSHTYIRYHKHN